MAVICNHVAAPLAQASCTQARRRAAARYLFAGCRDAQRSLCVGDYCDARQRVTEAGIVVAAESGRGIRSPGRL